MLMTEIRQCRECEPHLPLGPRPVLQAETTAKILIIGQAPGRRVHESGIPWDDASGNRLREWMGIERFAPSNVTITSYRACATNRVQNRVQLILIWPV